MTNDPYRVLGVARNATQDQIRRACRKLAKDLHPDSHPGDKAAEDRFVWDKSNETSGRFTKAGFTFDKARDRHIWPGGKHLTCTGEFDQGRILPYRASVRNCASCTLKPRCTSGPSRKVSRDIDEPVRDRVRALAGTEAFEISQCERRKVEMAFAHLKRILKLDRLSLRGLSGTRGESLLAATAQNLRKLANYIGPGPPRSAADILA